RVRAAGERDPAALTVALVCDPPNVIEHFDALLALLAPHARVVCIEPPGFGFSLPEHGFGFGFADFAACFEHALDALGEGPYLLAFPCIWGHLALQVAARRPDLVHKLMLWQTARWDEQVRWARAADPERILLRPFVGQATMALRPEKIAVLWYRAALSKGRAGELVPTLHDALRRGAFCCLGSLWQQWFDGSAPVPAPALAPVRVAQPTLLAWGAADRSHRETDRFALAAHVPDDARRHVFESAGHSPELETSAPYAEVLLNWRRE
ncbi:MAG: hypothetical protein QOI11_593, partial [Candidatus Eremiobacteraeota bacterium]|nr:hypothetical protein [Candidatus Eremiobacteraeota bacterium]